MRRLSYLGIVVSLVMGAAALGLVLRPGPGPAAAASQPLASTSLTAQEVGPAWLGVQLADLTPRLAQRLGLSCQEGVVILRVLPQSPAAQAGLQAKDIIVELNGQVVSRVAQVTEVVAQAKPGDKITLKVWRGDAERSLVVTLGTPPTPPIRPKEGQRPPPFGGFFKDRLGGLENLWERFLGGQFSFKDKEGQQVTFTMIAGPIAAVSSDIITITSSDGSRQVFQVTAETKILKGRQATALSELKEGDQVVVISTKPGVADAIATQGPPPQTPRPFRHWFNRRP